MSHLYAIFKYAFTLLFCLTLFKSSLRAQESRIWTDKSGKFEIRAKLIDVVEGKARLERPNGNISRIPLNKLSEADQQYIRDFKKGKTPTPPQPPEQRSLKVGDKVEAEHFNKWQLGTVVEIDYEWESIKVRLDEGSNHAWSMSLDDLRWPGTMQQPLLIKPTPKDTAGGDLKTVRPDMSDVALLLPEGSSSTTITPDPASKLSLSWKPKSVRMRGPSSVFISAADFVITEQPDPMALVLLSGGHSGDPPPRIEMLDLRTRKSITGGPALPSTGRLLLSPNGEHLVTFPGDRGGSKSDGTLAFWNIEGKAVSHWISFAPYVMNSWPDLDPKWVAWVDNDHVLTINREEKLILWEIETAKAKYELELSNGGTPILSHNREQLVVPTSDGALVFDPRSGELIATLGSGNLKNAALAFSPSGRQLAAVSSGYVDVIDVTTGKITRSFPCKDASSHTPSAWINEDYLFVSNSLVVNVKRRLVAWKYNLNRAISKNYYGTQWALSGNFHSKSLILSPIDLLAPIDTSEIDQLNDDQLLAVQPGASVSIDVRIRDSLLAKNVRAALTSALEEAGMTVAENQPLVLIATMKNGETQKITYAPFHSFGRNEGETFNVTSRVYELELQLDGVPIWNRTSTHSAPHHVRAEKGENFRSAVARLMKPRPENFRGRLPAYVVRPEYQEPRGTSKISAGR